MPRSKRDPSRRVGWSRLKAPYRRRLEAKGISRSAWENGVDLRAARGHTPAPPRGAAPKEIVERVVSGEGEPADLRDLGRWNETMRPRWIPAGMTDDVAAALSQLPPPKMWSDVVFYPASGGEPWRMVVNMKGNAYPVEILIPGGGAVGTGAREVLDLLTDPKLSGADMRYWKTWTTSRVEDPFDVMGST